jgi:formate dehydrogenase major subunit
MRPLRVAGQVVHQIGLPYHWGPNGLSTGDAANDLVNVTVDPNVNIQDKVGTCDIQPGRRPRGEALVAHVAGHRRRAGMATEAEARAKYADSQLAESETEDPHDDEQGSRT